MRRPCSRQRTAHCIGLRVAFWQISVSIFDMAIGAGIQQKLSHRQVALGDRVMQSGHAIFIDGIDARAGINQCRHQRCVAAHRGNLQWRVTAGSLKSSRELRRGQ